MIAYIVKGANHEVPKEVQDFRKTDFCYKEGGIGYPKKDVVEGYKKNVTLMTMTTIMRNTTVKNFLS